MRLNRDVRVFVAGVAVSSLGTGLVLPFNLIYLHQVRHIALGVTGLLLALPGAVGLVTVPAAGAVADRWQARRVLACLLGVLAVSQVLMAGATDAARAAPALLLFGVAVGSTFAMQTVVLSRLAPSADEQRRAFALSFTATNAGIGLGALVGAAVVRVAHPGTFQLAYLGNAVSCVLFIALLALLGTAAPVARDADEEPPGYRRLLADPLARRVCLLSLGLALTGYASLDSGLPAFATVVGGVGARTVALSLAVNTAVIVAAQLPLLRLLSGRRRTSALSGVGLLWALSWLLLGASGLVAGGPAAAGLVLVFGAVFALGETLMSPSLGPLVNALSTDAARGRYNALSGLMFSVAFVVAPAIAAGLVGAGLGWLWIGLLTGGAALVGLSARRFGRRLTAQQEGLAPPREAVTAAAGTGPP